MSIPNWTDISKAISRHIKSSEERTEKNVVELQKQIDDLKEELNNQKEEMKYLLDVIGRLGVKITQPNQ